MGFVDKWPSRMHGQLFVEVKWDMQSSKIFEIFIRGVA